MLISFIVPIYNVKEYLRECVESIAGQIVVDAEIILVDDGSTDGSGVLADHLAEEFDKTKVVHKRNGGLASARNVGLDAALGDYVAFVDSDDRIALGAVGPLGTYLKTNHPDVLFLDSCKFYPDGSVGGVGYKVDPKAVEGRSRLGCLEYLSKLPKFPESACMKLFNREFLARKELRFPEDGRYSEDLGFVLKSIMLAESFGALDVPYYEYRQNRAGSITNSIGSQHFNSLALFIMESVDFLTDDGKTPKDKSCACAMSFVAYEYSIMLLFLSKVGEGEESRAYKFLEKYRWVMRYAKGRKARMTATALKCLGISPTSRLLNAVMSRRHR